MTVVWRLRDFNSDELRAVEGSCRLLLGFAWRSVSIGVATAEPALWLDRLAGAARDELALRADERKEVGRSP